MSLLFLSNFDRIRLDIYNCVMREIIKNQRIRWIDMLKGITILLVAIHHSISAAYTIRGASNSPMFDLLIVKVDILLSAASMPAFFLAGGFVMASLNRNKVEWFLTKRLPFMIWIIFIWTCISFFAEYLGFHLYVDKSYPYLSTDNFFTPYWFIYALLLLSGLAAFVSRMGRVKQIIFTILFSLCFFSYLEFVDYKNLAYNICYKGIPFFMGGFIFKDQLISLYRTKRLIIILMVCIATFAMVAYYIIFSANYDSLITSSGFTKVFFVFMPVTLIFIGIVKFMSYSNLICNSFTYIGKLSLQIYLLHTFFVAFVASIYKHSYFDDGSISGKMVLILSPIILCVTFVLFSNSLLKPVLFSIPRSIENLLIKNVRRMYVLVLRKELSEKQSLNG